MRVEYVARNYDLDDRVRQYSEGKLRKLQKYLQEPLEARLTLEIAKHRNKADLHLAHRFGVIQATEVTEDMYDAINVAVDKAEKQARRAKQKFHDKRRRAERDEMGPAWPVAVIEGASLGTGGSPRVISSSRLQIVPMTVDEAAAQLADSKNDFFVFRDVSNEQVSVLYKRQDENYGLISTET